MGPTTPSPSTTFSRATNSLATPAGSGPRTPRVLQLAQLQQIPVSHVARNKELGRGTYATVSAPAGTTDGRARPTSASSAPLSAHVEKAYAIRLLPLLRTLSPTRFPR